MNVAKALDDDIEGDLQKESEVMEKTFLVPAGILSSMAQKNESLLRTVLNGCRARLAKMDMSVPSVEVEDFPSTVPKDEAIQSAGQPTESVATVKDIVQTATRRDSPPEKPTRPRRAKSIQKAEKEVVFVSKDITGEEEMEESGNSSDDSLARAVASLKKKTTSSIIEALFIQTLTTHKDTLTDGPSRGRAAVRQGLQSDLRSMMLARELALELKIGKLT